MGPGPDDDRDVQGGEGLADLEVGDAATGVVGGANLTEKADKAGSAAEEAKK